MRQYDELCDVAVANYGLVTAKSIDALGIHLKDVLEWVKSGRLEKRGRGVYRLVHYLPTEYDTYAEAAALVGDTAMICGESVLAMHNLALVNPARVMKLDSYLQQLNASLARGWNGFTGKLVVVEPPQPPGVPGAYVMMPYDIKLNYCGRPWQTIRIEIGHNEIGDADEFETSLPSDLAEVFEQLSFPPPKPLPVMKLSYQIAQKLHKAVSLPGYRFIRADCDRIWMSFSPLFVGTNCSRCTSCRRDLRGFSLRRSSTGTSRGGYPTSLGTLVPMYLGEVLRDPFAPDDELRYDAAKGVRGLLARAGTSGRFPKNTRTTCVASRAICANTPCVWMANR